MSHATHAQPESMDHTIPFEFMYMAPVGLILAQQNGIIDMMNPFASQLLMPLYQNMAEVNFFEIMKSVNPKLEKMVDSFSRPHGLICQGYRVPLPNSTRDASVLAIGISITKLGALSPGAHKLLIMVSDETQAFKQERIHHNKSEFWAQVSHEIRTPLNSMLGLTNLLGQSPLDLDQSNMLDRINEAGQILLHNLNDVLDFSKIESGKMSLQPRAFSLNSVVSNLCQLQSKVADSSGIALKFSQPQLDFEVHADDIRLSQILLNLTNNAIKFTSGRPTQEVSVLVHVVEQNSQQCRVRFEVTDTGVGIPANKVQQLFRPFSQVNDQTQTERFAGTGLGLSICKSLVNLMGGEIGVRSTKGQGSTFWFELTLPIVEAKTSPPEGIKIPSKARQTGQRLLGKTILVVDDNRLNRFMLERLLQHEGAQFIMATNGQEACELLSVNVDRFDLVLMDIQMPVMDGLAATRSIRTDLRYRHLPILICSAGVQAEDRQRAFEAGASGFVPKPLQMDVLLQEIERITQEQRADAISQVHATAQPAAQPIWVAIPQIDGLRMHTELSGDERCFRTMLKLFSQEIMEAIEGLPAEMGRADWDVAAKRLHKLRGSASTLHANQLVQACVILEKLLKSRNTRNLQTCTNNFIGMLRSTARNIQRHHPSTP